MKNLIVGVDPGTTTGYAVLDTDSKLVKIGSGKDFGISKLISTAIKLGRVLVVATDKAKVPSFVEEFGVKTGAILISPNQDMLVKEKEAAVREYEFANDHERDALAAALFAYKQQADILDRVKRFVTKEGKEKIQDELIELVLKTELNIKKAAELIESPEKEEVKIVKDVVYQRILREEDFLKLYDKMKTFERDAKMLKHQNNQLKKINEQLRNNKKVVKVVDKQTKDKLKFKDSRLDVYEGKLLRKDKELDAVKKKLNSLNRYLCNLDRYMVLKKMDNLGYNEYLAKNKLLHFTEDDILLVDDLTVISEKTVDAIKDRVLVVVYKGKAPKRHLPFVLLNSKGLDIKETDYFGFADKRKFEKEKNTSSLLNKIITDYKKERA